MKYDKEYMKEQAKEFIVALEKLKEDIMDMQSLVAQVEYLQLQMTGNYDAYNIWDEWKDIPEFKQIVGFEEEPEEFKQRERYELGELFQ